ncbi:MAG: acyl carrier protein [Oscillospiraceae bacterium]|nr:acyl carrier protein [Oscillospiraceae bacterium]MBQ9939388.1 acyl carrier protein [Oscillospiraceae bacterium]
MVFEKVRAILCDQLDVQEDEVTVNSVLTDDLGADSIDLVDLIMTLEAEFDIEIPDEDVEKVKTVGDVVKYIENIL